MATLTGNAINTSYQGLIKFDDNGVVNPTTLKQLTDGTGGSLPIQVSQIETKFQSLVDFTGATVTGLPVVEAGLEVGTGTNSLQNGIGGASTASGLNSLAIGNACTSNQEASISIGDRASATGYGSFAAGLFAQAAGFGGFALGQYAESSQPYGSAFGPSSRSTAESAVAFGQATVATHSGAVAMGRSVSTVNADTTHVRALYIVAPELGTGGNGITMLSPDGTAGVITLTNASELAIDGTPIGGGGAAGLVSGAAADSMISDASLTTNPASALMTRGIALGDNARAAVYANQVDGIAIGTNALSEATNSIAIGKDAYGQSGNEIAIGTSSHARLGDGIAIGRSSYAGNTGNIAIGKLANCDFQYTGVIALGTDTVCGANGAVAIGASVTASTVDTVTIKKLQMLDYATINFADDTAAATGGIPLGGVYHTSGTLKIRIA